MSWEVWGTPPDPEPTFCPICDQESHAEGCELGDMQARVHQAQREFDAYRDDVRRLTRELDVLLNGEEGAAEQASLCEQAAPVVRHST